MRSVALAVACVGIALTTAGCDPVTDKRYFREGVGTNLYGADVATQTERQVEYVAEICDQAGLADGACNIDQFSQVTWTQFVQAGMNDIDQRCDSYLTWLDYIRRSRDPTIKQLADMQTTSTVVMGATGVGAAPIAIVAAAVGLATNTFTNVTSRLILEVDHATVQAVVLSNQKKYREELFGVDKKPGVVIASRPAAIYALRSYLRLCMPMTIETQINNTIATFSRGGAEALKSEGMISAKSVGISSTKPPPTTPQVSKKILGAVGLFEPGISLTRGMEFQKTLCAEATGDFGPAGLPFGQASPTRTELREFNAAFRYGIDVPPDQLLGMTPDTVATAKDLDNLKNAQRAFPSCESAGMKNGFEVGIVTRFKIPVIKAQVAAALTREKLATPANFATTSGIFDGPLREAITSLRVKFDQGSPVLDPKFYDWFSRASDRN